MSADDEVRAIREKLYLLAHKPEPDPTASDLLEAELAKRAFVGRAPHKETDTSVSLGDMSKDPFSKTPSKRSPHPTSSTSAFVDLAGDSLFGRNRSTAHSAGTCVTCGKQARSFKDGASKHEYGISGMCQACQDDMFG
jgi:hypothetical protein